jgi:hypothetical protein
MPEKCFTHIGTDAAPLKIHRKYLHRLTHEKKMGKTETYLPSLVMEEYSRDRCGMYSASELISIASLRAFAVASKSSSFSHRRYTHWW